MNTEILSGSLLPETFFSDGISDFEPFAFLDDDSVANCFSRLSDLYEEFPSHRNPNESQTEDDLIWPILEAIGWKHSFRQQVLSISGQGEKPDGILFKNEEDWRTANHSKHDYQRYIHSDCIVENKRWGRTLDRRGKNEDDKVTPSFQILNYLTRANAVTEERLKWGILTNGKTWRLYWQNARSRREDFLGFDLEEIINSNDLKSLKAFILFFGPTGFQKAPMSKVSVIEDAIQTGRRFEAKLADDLSVTIFEIAFPEIAKGIYEGDPTADLHDVRDAALTALYRLLFILYAEDRSLLPIAEDKYARHSLRRSVRDEIGDAFQREEVFSKTMSSYWDQFLALSRAIDKGDRNLGIPTYNGGLFKQQNHVLLERSRLSNDRFAKVLRALCFFGAEDGRLKYVNFKDLSVQQLGSVYEKLLEYDLVKDSNSGLKVARKIHERKGSGSFYTREELVDLVLEQTLRPLIDKCCEATDPAKEILRLKVCDPAMGSGHFLVSLVDYLSEEIAEALARSDGTSAVMRDVDAMREMIEDNAESQGWALNKQHLDDPQLLRRMILKRCIYGVDKNPMAVELSKVALWLHTFTVGAPLSFLDHHLRAGDSVFGLWVTDWFEELSQDGQLLMSALLSEADIAEAMMQSIEMRADAEIDEVEASRKDYMALRRRVSNIEEFMSFAHAIQWLDLNKADRGIVGAFYNEAFGNPEWIITGKRKPNRKERNGERFFEIWEEARILMAEENFFHWEVGFPGVWSNWSTPSKKSGGFDAVIGNPPWNQFEFDRQEWWSRYRPSFKNLRSQSEVKTQIKKLRENDDALVRTYDIAEQRASMRVKQGKRNLKLYKDRKYVLHYDFIEQSRRLIRDTGRIGFIVPSGVVTNKAAEGFCKKVLADGNIESIINFQNSDFKAGRFFTEVHPQTKFCVLVYDEDERAEVGISVRTDIDKPIEDQLSKLPISTLDVFSPNSKLMPSFASNRVYEIAKNSMRFVKPFSLTKFAEIFVPTQMFNASTDMDDAIFYDQALTEGIIPTKAGYVSGKKTYLAELQGKNVGMYNHRSNGIRVEHSNRKRKAQEIASTTEDLKDPSFEVRPYRLAPSTKWPSDKLSDWVLAFKDVTAADNTRSMIASVIPQSIPTHTLPVFMPSDGKTEEYRIYSPLLLGCLNSLAYDFFVRMRLQTAHMSFYVVEEAPIVPLGRYSSVDLPLDVKSIIGTLVGRLSATSESVQSFGRLCGLKEGIVSFDPEQRLHDRAKLDALYLILYGLDENKVVDVVLESFDRLKKAEVKKHQFYMYRELVRGYVSLLKSGNAEATIDVRNLQALVSA